MHREGGERPWIRRLSSVKYNPLFHLLFKDGVYDHQCGFKAYLRKMADHILRAQIRELVLRYPSMMVYIMVSCPEEHLPVGNGIMVS